MIHFGGPLHQQRERTTFWSRKLETYSFFLSFIASKQRQFQLVFLWNGVQPEEKFQRQVQVNFHWLYHAVYYSQNGKHRKIFDCPTLLVSNVHSWNGSVKYANRWENCTTWHLIHAAFNVFVASTATSITSPLCKGLIKPLSKWTNLKVMLLNHT